MNDFIIITDSGSDLTKEWADEIGVKVIDLAVSIEGAEPVADSEIDLKELYAMLRAKKKATTSAVNTGDFKDAFRPYLEEGKDILYLGFSSGLSSTFHAGKLACEDLSEEFPERKLFAVDTLCASLGQGLLVYHAAKMRLDGKSIEDVRDFAENNKLKLCHWFTVDDLFFLKRGGRVSAASAVVGTMLGIKPIMHVSNEGKLVKVSTVRGRKASIDTLCEKAKGAALNAKNKLVAFISHGDCEEDAKYLAEKIKREVGFKDVVIGYVGPVIGSHSGPGTLALFYLGAER